jgi:two-component system chemotaxis response regulator CheB
MPRSALANVSVDYCLPVEAMPQLLLDLLAARTNESRSTPPGQDVKSNKEGDMDTEFTQNRPIAITCPDCGGALRRNELGRLVQFKCHIGHVYTAEVLLAAQFIEMERSIVSALRSLNERTELCRQMHEGTRPGGAASAISPWEEAMMEALDRSALLRQLLEREWIHPNGDSHSVS